jgi:hypothetical protein
MCSSSQANSKVWLDNENKNSMVLQAVVSGAWTSKVSERHRPGRCQRLASGCDKLASGCDEQSSTPESAEQSSIAPAAVIRARQGAAPAGILGQFAAHCDRASERIAEHRQPRIGKAEQFIPRQPRIGAQAGRHSSTDSRRWSPRIAEDGRRPPQHRETLAAAPCPSATEDRHRGGYGRGSLCFCPMAVAGNFDQTLREDLYLVGLGAVLREGGAGFFRSHISSQK